MGDRWFYTIVGGCSIAIVCFSGPEAAIIRGVVTDSLTKGPVDSALVKIKGTAVQTYTDAAGKFTLNVSTGISRPVTGMGVSPDRRSDASAILYAPNGSIVAREDRVTNAENVFSRLPDGVYLIKSYSSGRAYAGRLLKMAGVCRTIKPTMENSEVPFAVPLGKTGLAAVTLIYSHTYYTGREAAASEGDTNVAMRLSRWIPSPSTTGPTNPSAFTTIGSRTISTNGTVLENVLVNGTITIRASNVTVRNFKVLVDDYFAFDATGTGILLEDGEIDGKNTCDEAIRGSGYTARRLYIHNMEGDAFKADGNNVIEGCYITAIGQGSGAHGDGVQMMGSANIKIIHNNFNLTSGSLTACIFPGGGGYIAGVYVKGNRLNGGGWTIYCNADMVTTNNIFGRASQYGAHTDDCGTWTWNVYEDNGQAINP